VVSNIASLLTFSQAIDLIVTIRAQSVKQVSPIFP
jgi:hypothetical protein